MTEHTDGYIDGYGDEAIARILQGARVVAMVGASPKPDRPSHRVMLFLQAQGRRVIPVNPAAAKAGETINGEKVLASLADIPAAEGPVDMVDIFRAANRAGPAVDAAIAEKDRLGISCVWMQLDVIDEAAARRAREAGLDAVMDRCPAIEIPRLF
ncbi:MAG: CoA-binding protein [Rhodospirillales bacterium]